MTFARFSAACSAVKVPLLSSGLSFDVNGVDKAVPITVPGCSPNAIADFFLSVISCARVRVSWFCAAFAAR